MRTAAEAIVDYEAAVNVILRHGIGRDDAPQNEACLQDGFLGVLRPFSGLREENFLQVMEAIIALRPHLEGKQAWETRLVEGLWGLTTRARLWGLDPDGMLQRNRLLSDADTALLAGGSGVSRWPSRDCSVEAIRVKPWPTTGVKTWTTSRVIDS